MHRKVTASDRLFIHSRRIGLALAVISLSACGGGGSSDNPEPSDNPAGDFDQSALLSVSATTINNAFQALDGSVVTLKSEIDSYCAALGQADEETARTSAQQAFVEANEDLQRALMFEVGPAADEQNLVQIYSWPLSSQCQIDLRLANDDAELNLAVDRRGVDALEYLLFVEPEANHNCPDNFVAAHPVLTDFNNLSTAEKQSRRCAFMGNVVDDVATRAASVAEAWSTDGGDYVTSLSQSANTSEALNNITDALFYFEKVVKENKLDAPLGGGITNTAPSCGAGEPCPADVESPTARLSKENIIANMLSFQAIYEGNEDSSFRAWLVANDQAALATSFGDDIQAVIDGLNAIEGSLYDTIGSDLDSLNNLLQGPVQDVSKALRFEVIPALGLSLPAGSESDTD